MDFLFAEISYRIASDERQRLGSDYLNITFTNCDLKFARTDIQFLNNFICRLKFSGFDIKSYLSWEKINILSRPKSVVAMESTTLINVFLIHIIAPFKHISQSNNTFC